MPPSLDPPALADKSAAAADPAPTLAVDSRAAAAMIGVSLSTWARMVAAARTPAPLDLPGRVVRFAVADLQAWAAMGSPDRRTFEARKAADARKGAR